MQQKMPGYKLYYFNGRGRGETSRLSFAAVNIEFEDIRLAGEAWAKEKVCRFQTRVSLFCESRKLAAYIFGQRSV